jgi:hypothetical protein
MAKIGRLITAMVTPFNAKGEVDYKQAQKLAKALIDGLGPLKKLIVWAACIRRSIPMIARRMPISSAAARAKSS